MYRLVTAYSVIALALLLSPFAALLYYGYGPFLNKYAFDEALLRSMGLTFFASSIAVLLDAVLFTPLAYLMARRRNAIMNALADVPASVPHPLVGIALALLSSPQTFVGKALKELGLSLFDTYAGLIAALVIVSAPVYIRAAQSYFEALPREPELMAMSMGASDLRIFWLVLRGSARGLLASGLTAASRAISEFGSVAVIAYYVSGPPFGLASPASVYIWNLFETYYLSAISATATLFLFSLAVLALAHWLRL